MRSLRALRLLLPALAACASTTVYPAKNTGVQAVELQRKIPGACAVDVASIFDEKVCAKPTGGADGCMTYLHTAMSEMLTELGTRSCAGGDAAHPWVLKLEIPSFTRQDVEIPPTALAEVLQKDPRPSKVREYTLHIRFAVLDPKGREVVAVDRDLSQKDEQTTFEQLAKELLYGISATLTETVKKQAALGWE
jgi:hypothetical protein